MRGSGLPAGALLDSSIPNLLDGHTSLAESAAEPDRADIENELS